jgi:uncharacterized membrane protein
MSLAVIAALVGGAICAAAGQLLFAAERVAGRSCSRFSISIMIGHGLPALGTVLWIYSLSRAQLARVYPFTVLTFVFIYISAILLLGERLSVPGFCGIVLVLVGLCLLSMQ